MCAPESSGPQSPEASDPLVQALWATWRRWWGPNSVPWEEQKVVLIIEPSSWYPLNILHIRPLSHLLGPCWPFCTQGPLSCLSGPCWAFCTQGHWAISLAPVENSAHYAKAIFQRRSHRVELECIHFLAPNDGNMWPSWRTITTVLRENNRHVTLQKPIWLHSDVAKLFMFQ